MSLVSFSNVMCWFDVKIEFLKVLLALHCLQVPLLSGPFAVSIIQWCLQSTLVGTYPVKPSDVLVYDALLIFREVYILLASAPQ